MWVLIGLSMKMMTGLLQVTSDLWGIIYFAIFIESLYFPPSVWILSEFLRFYFVIWCAVRPLLNVLTKTFSSLLWHSTDRLDPVNKACDFKEAWWHFSPGVIERCSDAYIRRPTWNLTSPWFPRIFPLACGLLQKMSSVKLSLYVFMILTHFVQK